MGIEPPKNTVGTDLPKNTVGTEPPKYTLDTEPPRTPWAPTPQITPRAPILQRTRQGSCHCTHSYKSTSKYERKDWEHLSSLSLGTIVFASPKGSKAKSLPALIKKADLDGNRIFVLWDQEILNCVGDIPPSEERLFRARR